jgi:hypothetical protein
MGKPLVQGHLDTVHAYQPQTCLAAGAEGQGRTTYSSSFTMARSMPIQVMTAPTTAQPAAPDQAG